MTAMPMRALWFVPQSPDQPRAFRAQIEALVESLIDILDRIDEVDGFEMNGDELDSSLAEDDYHPSAPAFAGPGCPLADPDTAVDDEGCDEPYQDCEEEESYLVPVYAGDQSLDPKCLSELATVDRQMMRPHLARFRAPRRGFNAAHGIRTPRIVGGVHA